MTEVAQKEDVAKTIEETKEESDDDEEAPGLVAGNAEGTAEDDKPASRSEKKSRKAMAKLGLKPFPGCARVAMKRNKTTNFVIQSPDIFYNKNTYVIFGEARVDASTREAELLKAFEAAKLGMEQQKAAVAEDEDDAVDEEGVSPKDIEVVMAQASCTRSKAVKTLKANNNDVVQTIMDLSA